MTTLEELRRQLREEPRELSPLEIALKIPDWQRKVLIGIDHAKPDAEDITVTVAHAPRALTPDHMRAAAMLGTFGPDIAERWDKKGPRPALEPDEHHEIERRALRGKTASSIILDDPMPRPRTYFSRSEARARRRGR